MSDEPTAQKRVMVFDDNDDDYTHAQLFFRLAIAYADSSYHLVRSILEGTLPQTFAHAQTMHFLFDHAIELFLKGAIVKSTGQIENTHHLDQLHSRYQKLFPKKAFGLSGRILEAVKANAKCPHSEFPRYPVDTSGKVWEGCNAYTLNTWETEIQNLRGDLERLIPLIDPLPPPAIMASCE